MTIEQLSSNLELRRPIYLNGATLPIPAGSSLKVSSIVVDRNKWKAFKRKCPRHGDVTKVLNRLIEMFLNGEIKVTITEKF